MSQIKCEMCGGYHHPMVACHEKELTQLQSVVMEMGQEIHKLKATLRDEPCDECGVNTLALLKECDELKRLLAEKNETANIFMRQVKEAHDIIWDMCRNLDAANYARARKFVGLDTEASNAEFRNGESGTPACQPERE